MVFSRLLSALMSTLQQRSAAAFNGATGCSLFAGSDALAQGFEQQASTGQGFLINKHEHDGFQWDKRRLLSAGLLGIAFGGVVYPVAYAWLDKLWVGTKLSAVLKKSVLEIATVGIFVNSVSMCGRGLLVGRSSDQVTTHVVQEMPSVTLNDARVWLPYNVIAFSFIPVSIRPATTSLMEAMWQTYISLRSNDYVP